MFTGIRFDRLRYQNTVSQSSVCVWVYVFDATEHRQNMGQNETLRNKWEQIQIGMNGKQN